MFTGIVEEVGTVKAAEPGRLVIGAALVMDDMMVSHSIAVNGVCLTVTWRDDSSFSVDVVPETLRRSNLGLLRDGDPVNLERPLAANGRYGGHYVQGHIDATATVDSIEDDGEALLIKFKAPDSVMPFIVEKGFITIDGTSMTIVDCDADSFVITVIPFTSEHTIFGTRKVGDKVNLETDIIAKYVQNLLAESR